VKRSLAMAATGVLMLAACSSCGRTDGVTPLEPVLVGEAAGSLETFDLGAEETWDDVLPPSPRTP